MSRQYLPEKLNVCLVSRQFHVPTRSSEHNFFWLVAKGLASRGHQVKVLAYQNPKGIQLIEKDGVQVFYLGEGPLARRKLAFAELVKAKFTELHNQQAFHVLHSVDGVSYKISKYKKEYGIAVVYDVEATQMSQLFAIQGMAQDSLGSFLSTSIAVAYKFLRTFFGGDRLLLKTADGVFVTSPQQRIVLERYYLYPDARIYTVPYGIEVGDLSTKEASIELRQQFNISESTKVIVTISDMSELTEMKNLFVAFEKLVIKKPNCKLIVLGNGPKFFEIEEVMLNLALGSKVVLAGSVAVSEVSDYIAMSDVYLNLSARNTGFEPGLIEAMSQKKIIIGSEVSPIANVVEHSKDGFLIRPADIKELSQLLIDIFNDVVPVNEIGEAARSKILNLFDLEKMLSVSINAYYDILMNTGLYKRRSSN